MQLRKMLKETLPRVTLISHAVQPYHYEKSPNNFRRYYSYHRCRRVKH